MQGIHRAFSRRDGYGFVVVSNRVVVLQVRGILCFYRRLGCAVAFIHARLLYHAGRDDQSVVTFCADLSGQCRNDFGRVRTDGQRGGYLAAVFAVEQVGLACGFFVELRYCPLGKLYGEVFQGEYFSCGRRDASGGEVEPDGIVVLDFGRTEQHCGVFCVFFSRCFRVGNALDQAFRNDESVGTFGFLFFVQREFDLVGPVALRERGRNLVIVIVVYHVSQCGCFGIDLRVCLFRESKGKVFQRAIVAFVSLDAGRHVCRYSGGGERLCKGRVPISVSAADGFLGYGERVCAGFNRGRQDDLYLLGLSACFLHGDVQCFGCAVGQGDGRCAFHGIGICFFVEVQRDVGERLDFFPPRRVGRHYGESGSRVFVQVDICGGELGSLPRISHGLYADGVVALFHSLECIGSRIHVTGECGVCELLAVFWVGRGNHEGLTRGLVL